jgi:hypothetical protein
MDRAVLSAAEADEVAPRSVPNNHFAQKRRVRLANV